MRLLDLPQGDIPQIDVRLLVIPNVGPLMQFSGESILKTDKNKSVDKKSLALVCKQEQRSETAL